MNTRTNRVKDMKPIHKNVLKEKQFYQVITQHYKKKETLLTNEIKFISS